MVLTFLYVMQQGSKFASEDEIARVQLGTEFFPRPNDHRRSH
jgi:hypothetical protein